MKQAASSTPTLRTRRWALALPAILMAGLLSACATRQPPVSGPGFDESLSGRMSVRVAASGTAAERAVTVAFELRGEPEAGQIDLSTPLGSVVAQAKWSPGEVVLFTPQGERRFADLDSLSRETLGEAVPVAALFDWLRGRPWPGTASQSNPMGKGFSQLGWEVDLARFAESQVVARRAQAPAVTVRAVLDRP